MAFQYISKRGCPSPIVTVAVLLLFLTCFVDATAIHQSARRHPDHNIIHEPPLNGTQCSTTGNADLYGLGVRLGIYFQWTGSFLANCFIREEVSSQLDANAIFLLALIVALARGTMTYDIRAIDALVLLELCFGYFFSVLTLFGHRTMLYGKIYISTIGTYLRIWLSAAISGYAVWFWWISIDDLPQSPCPTVIFFFSSMPVLGGVRTFFRIASLLCAMYYCGLGVVALTTFVVWIAARSFNFLTGSSKGPRPTGTLKFWVRAQKSRVGQMIQWDPLKNPKLYHFIRLFNVLYIFWAMLTVEFTLNWNHVEGVTGNAGLYSTGQQLPTMIGAASFVRMLWLLWKQSREKRRAVHTVETYSESADMEKHDPESKDITSPLSPNSSIDDDLPAPTHANSERLPGVLTFDFLKRKRTSPRTISPISTTVDTSYKPVDIAHVTEKELLAS